MTITTVHLVRHGEVFNPEGVLYGRMRGYHLSDLGHEMARAVGEAFADGHDVRLVVTSPLERARETGAPTAKAFGLTPYVTADLIEADNKFEGLQVNKNRAMLAYPKFWPWYVKPWEPSWGEPYPQVIERMRRAIRTARREAEGGEAVLVSHQLPIWVTRLFVEGRPFFHDPRKRECSLASVTSLTFTDSTLASVTYWEPAGHLLRHASDMVPGTSEAAENQG